MDRAQNYDDNIAAQWRSWANSKVNYTADFPAQLLTGTELSDNSLAKGATRFEMIFDLTNPRAAKFICRDNPHPRMQTIFVFLVRIRVRRQLPMMLPRPPPTAVALSYTR